ncbi:hypothetical protein ACFX4N_24060 [Priestia sp. YIM B13551]|uniref:hypothetical protein n=1 Tax=Priestia sp. YIM B13551 TaxID=3366306 RepID=UPI003672E78D
MGKVIDERHLYAGGVETEDRRNELIILQDCSEEEGYGVYMMDGFSDWTSDTISFGYGPVALILSNEFFAATCNYYQHRLKEFTEPVELNSDNFSMDDDEWDKCWLKITHATEGIKILDELDEEESHLKDFKNVLLFTAKWGFKEE